MDKTRKIILAFTVVGLVAGTGGCAAPGSTQPGARQTTTQDDRAPARRSATKKGALSGALVGGLLGYLRGGELKDALAGAAVGAAVGALIGNYVDHKRERTAAQVYTQYGREPQVALNDLQLSQSVLRAGQQGEATVVYDLVAPDPNRARPVTHTLEYYLGDKRLAQNSQVLKVKPGGYRTSFPLGVPKGADEGEYLLVARVAAFGDVKKQQRRFRVVYARTPGGSLYVSRIRPD